MRRICVRGIIYDDSQLLLIRRIRSDREYYVFPGGGVENRETLLEALNRELIEEIGVKTRFIKELYTLVTDERIEHYMLCQYVSGDFGMGKGPEYTSEEYKSHGEYHPVKIKVSDIANYNVVPEKIKEQLLIDLAIDHTLLSIEGQEIE